MPTTARPVLLLALVCLPLGACLDGALPGPAPDPGPGSDGGSGSPDLPPSSCGDIATQVSSWIGAHQSCQSDADCTVVTTACGLDGACGTFANQGAAGATLDALVAAWSQRCTEGIDCAACPDYFPEPGCNDGVCGPRRSPPPPTGNGQIGDPCQVDGDCLYGTCLRPNDGFPDGYCTLRGCDTSDVACPPGTRCQDPGQGGAGAVCLRTCDATSGSSCRGDGYACCGGPGPTAPDGGLCVPSSSFLCGEF